MTQDNPSTPQTAPRNAADIGIRMGAVFATPFYLLFLLQFFEGYFYESLSLVPLMTLPLLIGRWYGLNHHRLQDKSIFNTAIVTGLILSFTTLTMYALTHLYLFKKRTETPIFGILFAMFAFFTIYSLILSMAVHARIKRLHKPAVEPGEA